jgi:patatin-like phospholipase/acyl hydrolase
MNVLSLQGGGILGMGQVTMLSQLESGCNKQCFEIFDMIAGTSVGSILACHLAIGIPASGIKDFFTVDSPKIFDSNLFTDVTLLWGTKYGSKNIESALQSRLSGYKLSDCKTKFLATAYDWSSDRPVYFKSYESSSENKDYIIIGNDSNIDLWQVARASSAAQSYFPAYQYSGMVLLDGGNTDNNAPDTLAIADALDYSHVTGIKMLSLGAGDTVWKESPNTMVDPSIATAGLQTITIVFSAGESSEVYKSSKILKNNYYRLSPDLGNGYAIDDASTSTLSALQEAAEKVDILSSSFIKQIT